MRASSRLKAKAAAVPESGLVFGPAAQQDEEKTEEASPVGCVLLRRSNIYRALIMFLSANIFFTSRRTDASWCGVVMIVLSISILLLDGNSWLIISGQGTD